MLFYENISRFLGERGEGRGGVGRGRVGPGEVVDLVHRSCLPGLGVLQVEGAHQVVLAPHVLRHKVNLHKSKHVDKSKTTKYVNI